MINYSIMYKPLQRLINYCRTSRRELLQEDELYQRWDKEQPTHSSQIRV